MNRMKDPYGVWNGRKLVFTLQKLCNILEIELPEKYKSRKDIPLDILTYNDFFADEEADKSKSVIFDVWPSKVNLEKYRKYNEEGVVFFSSRDWKDKDGNLLSIIKVRRGLDAWYKVGKYIKNMFDIPTIAITGSVGKTTTTLFTRYVFSEKYKVFVSGHNRNIAVEIIRQMMRRYSPKYQIHIQEAGGGRSKLVEESAMLLNADAFGITKISKTHHIDRYVDANDIFADKTSFDRHSKENAFGVINLDDESLSQYDFKHETVTYAIENTNAEYTAKDIKQEGVYLTFTVVHKDNSFPIKINIVGKHNVYNALMAIALAHRFGLTDEEIQRGFLKYKSGPVRQNVAEVSGRMLYIDSFNVCSDSILSCIETLSQFDIPAGNRKIAVIGGENALGDKSYDVNYDTGTKLKPHDIDEFIFVGPKEPAADKDLNFFGHGKAVFDGAQKALKDSKIMFTDDLSVIISKLKNETKPGDVILFKGNLELSFIGAIDAAFGTSYLINNHNFVKENITENDFNGKYAKEIEGVDLREGKLDGNTLNIPDTINGHAVFRVGRKAFAKNRKLRHINFGRNVKNIGVKAFIKCRHINELVIPENVAHIEAGAFLGCRRLKKVVFEGVEHIEKNAFRNCKSLRTVVFKSDSCKTIEKGAFSGCNNFEIISSHGYIAKKSDGEIYINDVKSYLFIDPNDNTTTIEIKNFSDIKKAIPVIYEYAVKKCKTIKRRMIRKLKK